MLMTMKICLIKQRKLNNILINILINSKTKFNFNFQVDLTYS